MAVFPEEGTIVKLTSVLILILLGAAASESGLARGAQGQTFVQSGSPMIQSGHVQLSRPGFVPMHKGQFHNHFRSHAVIVGVPFFVPFYYPYPYYYYPLYYPFPYYYPPVAATPYLPPAYIEQGAAVPAPPEAFWYYCQSANGYYPHVKECPEGWQRVAPQPPPVSGY